MLIKQKSPSFLGYDSLVFSKFSCCVRNPCEVVRSRAGFFEEKCFVPKMSKMGPKKGFFEFIEKWGDSFFQNSFYNEILYYLLCSCTNPIFWANLASQIWDKMLSEQSNCKIFRSAVSPERIGEIGWFFSCWCKFIKIKSSLKFFCGCRSCQGKNSACAAYRSFSVVYVCDNA